MDTINKIQAASNDPILRGLLDAHPYVEMAEEGPDFLAFKSGDWHRQIAIGDRTMALRGLPETIDNNPMVCADTFSLPDRLSHLVLIGLAPLADAGLIIEAPVVITNLEDSGEVCSYLAEVGWSGGVSLRTEDHDFKGVAVATIMAAISTPDDVDDLDALYEERYGRSFFIRRRETEAWDTQLVVGTPYAAYRLRIAEDQPHSLLTIQVMADVDGKLGRLGAIHALNVMCGFEESLGIL